MPSLMSTDLYLLDAYIIRRQFKPYKSRENENKAYKIINSMSIMIFPFPIGMNFNDYYFMII